MIKGSDESHGGAGDVGELYNAQTGTDVLVPKTVGILVDGHTYRGAICGSEDMDGRIGSCLFPVVRLATSSPTGGIP